MLLRHDGASPKWKPTAGPVLEEKRQRLTDRAERQVIPGYFLLREQSEPLFNQIAHFAAVIDGREKPLVSGREGLETIRVIEAIQQAAESGEAITLSH